LGYLVCAHPFLVGNGRTVMTVFTGLLRRAQRSIAWAELGKEAYLFALTQALRTQAS